MHGVVLKINGPILSIADVPQYKTDCLLISCVSAKKEEIQIYLKKSVKILHYNDRCLVEIITKYKKKSIKILHSNVWFLVGFITKLKKNL